MCDVCFFCEKPAYEAELRLTEVDELICHDCFDDGQACDDDTCDWHDLLTPDDLAAMDEMAADDRAHAEADRRAGL